MVIIAKGHILSSAASFCFRLYCVILIWPRPVTHAGLSVARIVVQSTLAGGPEAKSRAVAQIQ